MEWDVEVAFDTGSKEPLLTFTSYKELPVGTEVNLNLAFVGQDWAFGAGGIVVHCSLKPEATLIDKCLSCGVSHAGLQCPIYLSRC